MKKKIVAFLVAALTVQMLTMPVSALYVGHAENEPEEDPNFVEMPLEDFLAENPDYVGDDEPVSTLTEIETTEGSYIWSKKGSYWYLYDPQGNPIKNDWFKDYSGHWYYLNSYGRMVTGWWQVGNYWYYFNAGGIMQTDWYQVGSKWYYLRTNAVNDSYPVGSAVTGAQYLPTTKGSTTRSRNYYFAGNADCSMQEFSYPLDTSKTENLRVNRGIRTSDGHNGLDINSYWDEPITCVANGTVLYRGFYYSTPGNTKTGTGGTVIMSSKTSDGTVIYTRYFHMNQIDVTSIGSIEADDPIGLVGNKGEVYSSSSLPTAGKHLHIDMSLYGKYTSNGPTTLSSSEALNPAAFFPNINFLGSGFFGSDKN